MNDIRPLCSLLKCSFALFSLGNLFLLLEVEDNIMSDIESKWNSVIVARQAQMYGPLGTKSILYVLEKLLVC